MATTDQALLQILQYALLEAPDGGQSWPSGLWTRDELVALLTDRQNDFLQDVLLVVGVASLPVAAGTFLVDLPSDHLRTVSAVWIGDDGTVEELQRSDTFEADHALPSWTTVRDTPRFYMDDDLPTPNQIRIGPAPPGDGDLELLYVKEGAALTGNGVPLTVPDDFLQVLKYAVLASALRKDGRGRDETRAVYCDDRVQLGTLAAELILQGWA